MVGEELSVTARTNSGHLSEMWRRRLSVPGVLRTVDAHCPDHPYGRGVHRPRLQSRSEAEIAFVRIGPGAGRRHNSRGLHDPVTTTGGGKPVEFRRQQRQLPLVEHRVPVRSQGPRHREVRRVQVREGDGPSHPGLGASRDVPPVTAHRHVDHPPSPAAPTPTGQELPAGPRVARPPPRRTGPGRVRRLTGGPRRAMARAITVPAGALPLAPVHDVAEKPTPTARSGRRRGRGRPTRPRGECCPRRT